MVVFKEIRSFEQKGGTRVGFLTRKVFLIRLCCSLWRCNYIFFMIQNFLSVFYPKPTEQNLQLKPTWADL